MGAICSICGKKKTRDIDNLLNASGKYCYHCGTMFADKKKFNNHLAGCDRKLHPNQIL